MEDGEEENSAVGEELGGEDLGERGPRHGGREEEFYSHTVIQIQTFSL